MPQSNQCVRPSRQHPRERNERVDPRLVQLQRFVRRPRPRRCARAARSRRRLTRTSRQRAGVRRAAHRAAGIGDPVAGRDVGHALAHRQHLTRALVPGREGQSRRCRIETRAKVGVDVVQTDRRMADQRFARAGRSRLDILQAHDLRSAGLMHPDSLDHDVSP